MKVQQTVIESVHIQCACRCSLSAVEGYFHFVEEFKLQMFAYKKKKAVISTFNLVFADSNLRPCAMQQ